MRLLHLIKSLLTYLLTYKSDSIIIKSSKRNSLFFPCNTITLGGTSKPIAFLGSENDCDDYLLQPHFVRKKIFFYYFFMFHITEFWNNIAFREFSKTLLLLQISTITVQHLIDIQLSV